MASLFASGAPPFEGKERFFASRSWLMSIVVGATMYMPDPMYWWLSGKAGVIKHPDLRAESRGNYSMQLLRNGYAACLSVELKKVGEIEGVRTCVVVGGKQDSVDVTRRMGQVLRESAGNSGCKAYVVKKAIHAWDWQFPELFTQGITAWAKESDMPKEYEELV